MGQKCAPLGEMICSILFGELSDQFEFCLVHLIFVGTGSGSSQKSSGSQGQAGAGQKSAENQEQAGGAKEGMLGQMAHKAAELYEGVKGTVAPALENVKEKASEAWHAVAGTIGAGPGPELNEDYTERVVAGQETQSSKEVNTAGN